MSKHYETYYPSLTSAVRAVEKYIADRGFTVTADELTNVVGFGPAKPTPGNTNKYHLEISKNGKIQRKKAHFQVYNRGYEIGNNMELNLYIS